MPLLPRLGQLDLFDCQAPAICALCEISLLGIETQNRIALIRGAYRQGIHGRGAEGKSGRKQRCADSREKNTKHGQKCEEGLTSH